MNTPDDHLRGPLMTQLALDLFGTEARREDAHARSEGRRAAFVARHQIGQIRLPWDTAGGDKAGDLIPAWRCCRCGAIEMSPYLLMLDHGCEDRADGCLASCQYTRPEHRMHPYRMDAHWIPPTTEDVTR